MNPYLTAAGLGAVTGLRSMTGLAMVSREWSDRRVPWRATRLREWMAEDLVAHALSTLALGELVGDKLPGVPDRVAPGPLFGRAVIGGLIGALVAGDDHAAGIAAGAFGAVAGAVAGWWLRREAGRRTSLPDAALAVVEDTMALAAAHLLVRDL